jgi:hypothetical protein
LIRIIRKDRRRIESMFNDWSDWIAVGALFALEAQGVIAMRLMKIAEGGPEADAECQRMVTEKFAAASASLAAATKALATGKSFEAAAKLALAPIRRSVRANHRRLSRG